MILDETLAFLRNVPPFQFLEPSALEFVAKNTTLEFYPKGTCIIPQNSAPSETLRIIKKGAVKLTMNSPSGEELLIDYRAEGETFGFLSLVSKEKVRTNVIASDDTLCFLLGKETLLKLLAENLAVTEYFLKFNVTKYVDRTYQDIQNKSILFGAPERLLFTTKVGDICTKTLVRVDSNISIQEAARLMGQKKISCLIVCSDESCNSPLGIVTERDLREKVVATGLSVSEPIFKIVSQTFRRLKETDTCFEATLQMVRNGVRHLLVYRGEEPLGILTNHDLIVLQGQSPLSLTKEIEDQSTLEGVFALSKKINPIIGILLKEGAKASHIAQIITEINDRLSQKVLYLTEKELGPPPVPYCWIVFGSEGRKEQTFKTDQDNALIYADPTTPEQAIHAEQYFADFSERMKLHLVACGFPLCPGNYMASNPQWRLSLQAWKKCFADWVSTPTPEAILHSLTLFDFRGLYGDLSLATQLRAHLNHLLSGKKLFLGHLANQIIKNTPPIGFLRSFVVDRSGEHKDQLNLKIKGLAPLIDLVRLSALERAITDTSTLDRLTSLNTKGSTIAEFVPDVEQAFEFILLLRIHHQFQQITNGEMPNNFINPNNLSHLEKRSLKEAFQLVTRIQNLVIERYKSMIW